MSMKKDAEYDSLNCRWENWAQLFQKALWHTLDHLSAGMMQHVRAHPSLFSHPRTGIYRAEIAGSGAAAFHASVWPPCPGSDSGTMQLPYGLQHFFSPYLAIRTIAVQSLPCKDQFALINFVHYADKLLACYHFALCYLARDCLSVPFLNATF